MLVSKVSKHHLQLLSRSLCSLGVSIRSQHEDRLQNFRCIGSSIVQFLAPMELHEDSINVLCRAVVARELVDRDAALYHFLGQQLRCVARL